MPARGAMNCDWAGIKSRQGRWSSRVVSSRKSLVFAILWLRFNYHLINTHLYLPLHYSTSIVHLTALYGTSKEAMHVAVVGYFAHTPP